ncbi:MAG: ParB/RepB/Spo0J family partition protein [Candidatus Sumerlaeaceae bacterium]|nr:ParB/RepB/Spo0J family partition protein [Candidatus Sumerlaeaceae bacterium]
MQSKKRALGKGLGALFPSRPAAETPTPAAVGVPVTTAPAAAETFEGERVRRIPVGAIRPNPLQPRQAFDDAALDSLAASIRSCGVIQPVAVMRRDGAWILVAGERRWRAAQRVGLTEIPAIEVSLSDEELLAYALVENLQRENLNPVEEARAYEALIQRFGLSQEEVAERVGRSRPAVANALRLLSLQEPFLADLESGRLTAGHARALLMLPDEPARRHLRDAIVKGGWSVRAAEHAAQKALEKPRKARPRAGTDADTARLREALMERLACRVDVKAMDGGRGRIDIHYSSLDELERILAVLDIEL